MSHFVRVVGPQHRIGLAVDGTDRVAEASRLPWGEHAYLHVADPDGFWCEGDASRCHRRILSKSPSSEASYRAQCKSMRRLVPWALLSVVALGAAAGAAVGIAHGTAPETPAQWVAAVLATTERAGTA